MGLDKSTLPDSILKRITPADRKLAGLPGPLAETVKAAADKADLRREKELQRDIENWLRLRGITAIRSRMDRKTSNNCGTPDFLFAVRGQAVAIEVKLPGCSLSDDQIRIRQGMIADGWNYSVVTSLDEAIAVVAGQRRSVAGSP